MSVWLTRGMAKGVTAQGMPEMQLKGITEVVQMLTTMRLEIQEVAEKVKANGKHNDYMNQLLLSVVLGIYSGFI